MLTKNKRVEILLPEDHLIFEFPKRYRTRIMKHLIDTGILIVGIEAKLNALSARIDELENPNISPCITKGPDTFDTDPVTNRQTTINNIKEAFGIHS